MSEPIRLAKRVVELLGCSRQEAEQYIQGGWVLVDGEVVDEPQFKVLDQRVELDANATLAATEPATLLLHKPAGLPSEQAAELLAPGNRWAEDASGIRRLRRHFLRQTPVMPLETAASGLLVLTQDPRLLRRMREDATRLEQEFNVEVSGEIVPYGLRRLAHGLSYQGRTLPPGKVSWQNETRLRFALKDVREGQLSSACADVGLTVVSIKRIRIGRVPLAKMPAGEWRYLPDGARL
jgi:23S rRNA pseudouridine2604 synthase